MEVSRFDVFLVNLDPTVGSDIRKSRPCVVISPDEQNRHIRTVVVAPMTTGIVKSHLVRPRGLIFSPHFPHGC